MSDPLRLRFVTDSCLLVINTKGKIKILYTPFRVLAIITAEGLSANTHVYVDAVFHHKQHRISYLINGKIYPYNYFQINVSF
jgi:hypothetical protein